MIIFQLKEQGDEGEGEANKEGITSDWSDFDDEEEEVGNLNVTKTRYNNPQQQRDNHIHRDGTYSMDSLDGGHYHHTTTTDNDNSESESIVGIPRRRPEGASPVEANQGNLGDRQEDKNPKPSATNQENLNGRQDKKQASTITNQEIVHGDQGNRSGLSGIKIVDGQLDKKKLIQEDLFMMKEESVNLETPPSSDPPSSDSSQRRKKKISRESSKKHKQNPEKIEMQETVNLESSNNTNPQDVVAVGIVDPTVPQQEHEQQQETGFTSSNSSSPRHRPSPILYPKSPSALKNLNASPSKDSLVRQYSTTSRGSSTVSLLLIRP